MSLIVVCVNEQFVFLPGAAHKVPRVMWPVLSGPGGSVYAAAVALFGPEACCSSVASPPASPKPTVARCRGGSRRERQMKIRFAVPKRLSQ